MHAKKTVDTFFFKMCRQLLFKPGHKKLKSAYKKLKSVYKKLEVTYKKLKSAYKSHTFCHNGAP